MSGVKKFFHDSVSYGVVVGFVMFVGGIFTWNLIPVVIGFVGMLICTGICCLLKK